MIHSVTTRAEGIMVTDGNERLSNCISSTQRHCRWRYSSFLNLTTANPSKKKWRRPFFKCGILVLVTVVVRQLPSISVHAHLRTSLYGYRDLQVRPTSSPSGQPSLSASPSRSFQPSPTPSISQEPSISPSRRTTSAPTLRPISAFPSSARLTLAPTEVPTLNPTSIPTSSPTPYPQTDDPTLIPTLDGTTTFSPTLNPSINPTSLLYISEAPTLRPTMSPTLSSPTLLAMVALPTDAPVLSFKHRKTTLRVQDAKVILFRATQRYLQDNQKYELDANCTLTWQVSVQERIESEMASTVQDYEALNVELRDLSTSSNETALSLTFDVFMEIRAASTENLDPIRIVVGAFDSQSDKISFIQYLKSTHCDEFDDIDTVSIHVPTEGEGETTNKSSSQTAALYASLVVGLAAIVMTGITVCCFLHSRNKRRVNDLGSAHLHKDPTSKSNRDFIRHVGRTPSVVGGKSRNSDVSTLGDPIPFGVIPEQNDDLSSANESCSLEYDFKKAFLDLHSVTDSLMCGTIDDQVSAAGMTLNDDGDEIATDGLLPHKLKLMTALADDIVTTTGDDTIHSSQNGTLSVENEYEVIVPPGLLGLILESHPDSGRPMINSIKPNTVLFSVVQVGDYIDAVDGVCVKQMSATEVSHLIVQKKDDVRILELARPIKRKTYHL